MMFCGGPWMWRLWRGRWGITGLRKTPDRIKPCPLLRGLRCWEQEAESEPLTGMTAEKEREMRDVNSNVERMVDFRRLDRGLPKPPTAVSQAVVEEPTGFPPLSFMLPAIRFSRTLG